MTREQSNQLREVLLLFVLVLKRFVEELHIEIGGGNTRVKFVQGVLDALHHFRDVHAGLGADKQLHARPPRTLAEDIQGKRPNLVAQGRVVEVLADTGNFGQAVGVALDLVADRDVIHFLGGLIQDIDSVFRLLVGGREIAAFHDFYSHEIQEVP